MKHRSTKLLYIRKLSRVCICSIIPIIFALSSSGNPSSMAGSIAPVSLRLQSTTDARAGPRPRRRVLSRTLPNPARRPSHRPSFFVAAVLCFYHVRVFGTHSIILYGMSFTESHWWRGYERVTPASLRQPARAKEWKRRLLKRATGERNARERSVRARVGTFENCTIERGGR